MANVLLTEECIRSCPYCFAKKYMANDASHDFMSWDNLMYIADLLETSREQHISLLGGEPLLHPEFVDFVRYLLGRKFHVTVFTSGITSTDRLDDAARLLGGIGPESLSFTVNMNEPRISPDEETEKVGEFLWAFGRLSTLGFNIYTPDFSLDFLFDNILRYGAWRHIRIGLAHPIPGDTNASVEVRDIAKVVRRFMTYVPTFERLHITAGFDCGMPLCCFSDKDLGALYKVSGGNLRFGCSPAIDIGPDMTVWSCFPLSGFHRKSLYDFDSIQAIQSFYMDLHRKMRVESGGIMEACDGCVHREHNLCQGGCLAHLVAAFGREQPVRCQEAYG